ncbi:MAG: GNAT family N-acetyltransferase [Deltaproteobacteria bacterium]|nr:GNAT family N-acetyltransferase [Deltaproteobacteria bacterium]
MDITLANIEDSEQILSLQKLAYQSEAAIYQDYSIPPLTQTIEEIKGEFENLVFLKAIYGKDILGSVRAYSDSDSCFIGRLIVHPEWQGKGIGSKLMNAIEVYFYGAQRYELFTGTKSMGNVRLYKRLGYKPFKEEIVNESVSLIYMEKTGSTIT